MESLEDKRISLLQFCYLQLCITAFISFSFLRLNGTGLCPGSFRYFFWEYINLQSLYSLHYFNTWAPHNLSLSLLSRHPRCKQFLWYQLTKRKSKCRDFGGSGIKSEIQISPSALLTVPGIILWLLKMRCRTIWIPSKESPTARLRENETNLHHNHEVNLYFCSEAGNTIPLCIQKVLLQAVFRRETLIFYNWARIRLSLRQLKNSLEAKLLSFLYKSHPQGKFWCSSLLCLKGFKIHIPLLIGMCHNHQNTAQAGAGKHHVFLSFEGAEERHSDSVVWADLRNMTYVSDSENIAWFYLDFTALSHMC